MRQSIPGGAARANIKDERTPSLPPTRSSRAWPIAGGFSVILLFVFSEALPFAPTFSKMALNATVHVIAEGLDFFWASVVGLFIWDLGAGSQSLAYRLRGLNEPYGNHIFPVVVTTIDCVGIVLSCVGWKLGLDPGKVLARVFKHAWAQRARCPLEARPG